MKDFIPYTEALALKELGFDEPVIATYEIGYEKDLYPTKYWSKDNRNSMWIDGIISAPTYSQAFRWFREKYFIYHRIDRDYDDWTYELCEFKSGNKHIPTGFKKFNSYEEAELACLRKLIEIVKNK